MKRTSISGNGWGKGTSGMPVKRLFEFRNYKHTDDYYQNTVKPARISSGPLSSGEGIIYAVRDPIESWQLDKKTKQGEYIITDPGIDDKRLFVLDEEFASALSCTKREGNTLSTILKSMWDSGDLDPLTKTTKIKSTGAHIGICTHITIKELNKKLDETEAFNGFANRFLWCCARRSKLVPFPEPMPEEKLMQLQIELKDIINSVHKFKKMTLSSEYKKKWGEVYPEISKDHDGLVGNVINRAEAQVIRLSMIYALLEAQNEIMLKHLNAALAMWNYCENSARFIFSDHEPDPYANKIVEALKTGPKSKTEFHNLFNRKLKREKLNSVLKELIAQGKIKTEKIKTKGKSKRLFQLSN
jgi:hypothetical protein